MGTTVKYYLVKEVPFTLVVQPLAERRFSLDFTQMSVAVDTVRPTDPHHKDLLERLSSALGDAPLTWSLHLRWKPMESGKNGETEFRLTFEEGSALKQVLGEAAACLQAQIFMGADGLQFGTQEMPASTATLDPQWDELVFVDNTTNIPVDRSLLNREFPYKGTMALLVMVIDKTQETSLQQVDHNKKVCKRMLQEEIVTDAIILPSNGTEVKCHRVFLAAQSDVFRTMFGTVMQEARTRKIEMPDMSEEGVRALLAYLYHCDLTKAQERCTVALELLRAAHKYIIGSLEEAMRKLLLSKPMAWYDVDVALKMFLFARNLNPEWESLKIKAVMVFKKNSGDLKNSVTFQELFRDNPEVAMDFYQYSISV